MHTNDGLGWLLFATVIVLIFANFESCSSDDIEKTNLINEYKIELLHDRILVEPIPQDKIISNIIEVNGNENIKFGKIIMTGGGARPSHHSAPPTISVKTGDTIAYSTLDGIEVIVKDGPMVIIKELDIILMVKI